MTGWIVGALIAAAAQSYGSNPPQPPQTPQAPTATPEEQGEHLSAKEAKARMEDCGEHRFEATAAARIQGKRQKTKLVLCSDVGATREQWIERLEKAAKEVETSEDLNDEIRGQLLRDLRKEIGKARAGS